VKKISATAIFRTPTTTNLLTLNFNLNNLTYNHSEWFNVQCSIINKTTRLQEMRDESAASLLFQNFSFFIGVCRLLPLYPPPFMRLVYIFWSL
jgi:hypothetical protein